MFDWKSSVPVWAVLRFAQMRDAFTAGGTIDKSIWMTGWKATPKGGKLAYAARNAQGVTLENTVQLYK